MKKTLKDAVCGMDITTDTKFLQMKVNKDIIFVPSLVRVNFLKTQMNTYMIIIKMKAALLLNRSLMNIDMSILPLRQQIQQK
ncbi:MAG: hypothetical protein COB07_09820 [Sulfurovum sp.]|nr:MAG: hypothetical protein COB07_09820 [Sulfurovum sp.]